MTVKWRLSFVTHVERSGRVTISARVTIPGMRKADVAIGRSLPDRSGWDSRRGRAVPSAPEARQLNLLLSDIEAAAGAWFARLELVERRLPTRDEVVLMLKRATGRTTGGEEAAVTLDAVLAAYMAAMDGQWTDGTRRKYNTLRRHLTEYRPGALMADVDAGWLSGFCGWLLRDAGLRNVTILKNLKALRACLAWASRTGRYTGTAHTDYRPRLKGTGGDNAEIVYLTIRELQEVERYDLPDYLAAVRDVFVFCCYTGLRFSDAARLRHDDDHGDHIEVVAVKTGERLSIELNTHARAILDRWRRLPNMALPAISNQHSNRHLKTIGRLCRLEDPVRRVWWRGAERCEEVLPKWRLLTTHVARRTFVVTALTLGIPAEVVIKWTGHSDYAAMRPYVAIVDELRRRNMDKFDKI